MSRRSWLKYMVTEQVKLAADAASIGVVGATLVGWLPSIAAVVAIVWTCVRTYTHVVDWREQRALRRSQQKPS